MKPGTQNDPGEVTCSFSTLNSGLRDETYPVNQSLVGVFAFSTLNSGLRDETYGESEDGKWLLAFSTLNSGLRDETAPFPGAFSHSIQLSVPSTRAYAMKHIQTAGAPPHGLLSVPSTRAYAMKPLKDALEQLAPEAFSTLNSGLRDETCRQNSF